MYKHFQQDFLIAKHFTTAFFDPEPAGGRVFYHVKFNIAGQDYHVVMGLNQVGEWEMEHRELHGQLRNYEQQFVHAIKSENLMTDNL